MPLKSVPTILFRERYFTQPWNEEWTWNTCLDPPPTLQEGEIGEPCPPGLECRQMSDIGGGFGLFVKSGFKIPKGTVVGKVVASEFTEESLRGLDEEKIHQIERYGYSVSVLSKKNKVVRRRHFTQADGFQHNFLRRANDAPTGSNQCNMELWTGCYEGNGEEKDRILVMGTTRDIYENEELRWDYGERYKRDW